jgi:hypothetical protein
MILNSPSAWSALVTAAPLFIALPFFVIFYLQRANQRRKKPQGKGASGFTPSTFALGLALQHLEMFTHPSVDHVIQEKYDDEAEEEGDGDPDHPTAQLHRQLRRIRRGEEVDRLILRLK